MTQTEITTTLAVWGAVTGTIGTLAGTFGLWLRFRRHRLDKAKICCESTFGFDSPTDIKHKITIRSVGRRPVSIDCIRYYIRPQKLKHRLTKYWQHRRGKWIWDQQPKSKLKLGEGEKIEINISLINGLEINEIYRAAIVDQAGNSWPIKWPSLACLSKIATQDEICRIEKENEKRTVSAIGYRLGERYYLKTKFNTKPARDGISGRSFWFIDLKSYEKKLKEIVDEQLQKFLVGEIEEIV